MEQRLTDEQRERLRIAERRGYIVLRGNTRAERFLLTCWWDCCFMWCTCITLIDDGGPRLTLRIDLNTLFNEPVERPLVLGLPIYFLQRNRERPEDDIRGKWPSHNYKANAPVLVLTVARAGAEGLAIDLVFRIGVIAESSPPASVRELIARSGGGMLVSDIRRRLMELEPLAEGNSEEIER